jgi:cytochrome c-type biogenesis protein CcmH/NrfG
MPAFPPSLLSCRQPSPRAWRALALALLGTALLPLLGLIFDFGPDFARRSVVLHAAMAGVLLPLSLLGQLAAAAHPAPAWTDRLLWLTLAGASAVLAGLVISGAGQALLLSFFPLLRRTIQPLLLIAPLLVSVIALLIRPSEVPRQGRPDASQGWLALPLLVTLLVLAWSWIASADVAPHVREELVAWGTGHAWMLALTSLSVRGWLQIAEVSGRPAVAWTRMMALAATVILLVPAGLPVDSAEYLKTLSALTLALCGLVPAALAFELLRDPVRRAVGGAWLLAAIATFFVPLAGAAWLLLGTGAGDSAVLRGGPLMLQHGLGLAATLSLWAANRQGQGLVARSPAAAASVTRATAASVLRLAAVTIVGGLVLTLALDLQQGAGKKPLDPAHRQHAIDRRQQEIAERFRQGVTMMQLRRYDDAVTAFHRVLALDPTIPEAHVNIGFALYETGQHAAAQRFFESATRLDKDQLNAYYGLALAARAQGANAVAAGAMRTWLHLAPPDDPFRARAEALFDAAVKASKRARPAASAKP